MGSVFVCAKIDVLGFFLADVYVFEIQIDVGLLEILRTHGTLRIFFF